MRTKSLLILCLLIGNCICTLANERKIVNLSGEGWFLWQDKEADWRNEEPHFNYAEALKHPIAQPSQGWEVLMSPQALPVSVPGTAEEYLQTIPGPEGDILGVTWWTREVDIPHFKKGQKVVLRFSAIRLRAEIFINRQLADCQVIDNVAFETDITPFVKSGETCELAVRITDAGGNHDWRDSRTIPWKGKMLPPGHGFGGVTGEVSLKILPEVHVADIYMQNTPEIKKVNANILVHNASSKSIKRDVYLTIHEWKKPGKILCTYKLKNKTLKPGDNELSVPIIADNAQLWSVETPNLYICQATLGKGKKTFDQSEQRFGFRWFEASGIGNDAVFRLNGKRIVLRSAISWSFWPVNGIFPTKELAKRQIEIAKELGLNMLNFHRFIGHEDVLDYADELGLLYFEEPGGFRLNVKEPFLNAVLHEKVLRMVKRDRSHPSLVIYNLMNESGDAAPQKLELEMEAMKAMHQLDPSRVVLRTSAWAKGDYIDDQSKIHMRPYDSAIYWNGWYDYHRAGGPAVWNEGLYKGPDDYYNNTSNQKEIVFFGEEGALSSPPRLEKNMEDLKKRTYLGWDSKEFIRWYKEFEQYLDNKNLRNVYPTVDDLCVAMGTVSYEHQGRKIESARLNNLTDAYVVNGWESELTENYSGIVDCFRYPKSDPSIIARYNQPLYVAVKTRQQIAATGTDIVTDFYLINEKDVKGNLLLVVSISDTDGEKTWSKKYEVRASGGETYGEPLIKGISIPMPQAGGTCRIKAQLYQGKELITEGYDDVLAVNLSSNPLKGKGAVWEDGFALQNFLKGKTQEEVVSYSDQTEKMDWIIVARPPKQEQLTMVPTEALFTADGKPGLECIYYEDMLFEKEVYREVSKVVNLSAIEGATPSPFVHMLQGYGIKWKGVIVPQTTGEYTLMPQSNNRSQIELDVNGKTICKMAKTTEGDGKVYLEAGKPATIEIRFKHPRSNARCRLDWAVPNENMPCPQKLMERAQKDGTKIFIIQSADEWSEYIASNSNATFQDKFFVGTNWLGGVMFNKPHAIFKELPSGSALNWPYQALIHTGVERQGIVMNGEELLVGAYHTYPMAIGTAMGIVPMGKGSVLFSTLDIYGNIINPSAAGLVAQKLIFNMIDSSVNE
ncbi:MAG: glycoside hydrolase family 2 [Bacteroides sp.]|nr:glycoside hydrolase family 2 [Bacteroides sp.]